MRQVLSCAYTGLQNIQTFLEDPESDAQSQSDLFCAYPACLCTLRWDEDIVKERLKQLLSL